MFKTIFNKFLMILYFVVGALILEVLTFDVLGFGGMPEYFWYNLALIIFVAILVYIIPNYTAQFVVYSVILAVQAVLIYVNYSLTKVYGGELLSIEMIRLIKEAGAAMTSSFVYIAVILKLILVYALIFVGGLLLLKYCRMDKHTVKQHYSIFSVILILSVQLFSVGFSIQTRDKINSKTSFYDAEYALTDEFKMNSSYLKSSSYVKFGTYGYFANMIINSIRNDADEVEAATLDYFNKGKIYGEDGNASEVFGIDEGNNVIVFMMESVEWFGFGDGKYDPTFENLVYVDDQLNEKTFTPNITKLLYGEDYLTSYNQSNDALIAKNFFAKSKTNMSEGQGIIGNYPVSIGLTDIVRMGSKSTFGYSMPSVLSDMGYNTTYVHSHKLKFYSRNKTHKALGFDKVIGKDSLKDSHGNPIYEDLDFDNWAAEGDFAEHAIDYLVPTDRTKPFYTFYLNVTSHGAYTLEDNYKDGDALKYYDYIKFGDDDCYLDSHGNWKLKDKFDGWENKDYEGEKPTYTKWYQNALTNHPEQAEELVYYECGIKGLDDAVGIIVDKLKEYNIMDKTTLLFYADHNAYYDDLSHNVKGLDPNNNHNQELNTIPMFIVSPGLQEFNALNDNKYLINDRFTTAYDVIPTLFELLGVKFNENLYLGHSLFRPADYIYNEGGVTKDMVVYYSNTGGLYGDGIYTFNLETFITSKDYSESTIELFSAECAKQLIKINFLGYLNRYDLYHKLTNV